MKFDLKYIRFHNSCIVLVFGSVPLDLTVLPLSITVVTPT